jgi:hypothetical protein
MKINLLPLDEQAARVLAERRGLTVDALVSSLIREEATIEITNWRGTSQHDTPQPGNTSAQPDHPKAVQP